MCIIVDDELTKKYKRKRVMYKVVYEDPKCGSRSIFIANVFWRCNEWKVADGKWKKALGERGAFHGMLSREEAEDFIERCSMCSWVGLANLRVRKFRIRGVLGVGRIPDTIVGSGLVSICAREAMMLPEGE